MSELMLNVLDGEADVHGRTHGSLVDVVVAALSADPETVEELEAAMARFVEPAGKVSPLAHCAPGICEEPWDAGICIVDLAARLVVNCSHWSVPGLSGQVAYHDGKTATEVRLSYHLAEDWEILRNLEGWEACAEPRRRDRQVNPPWDAREILYGKVAEFITNQCLAIAALGESGSDPIAEIHARWLLMARDDLRSQPPRDILLAKRQAIDLDLWDRCAQWSVLGECPPGLTEGTRAYRLGGFGTHEIVLYYDLMRFLMEACWERVRRHPEVSPTAEVRRLERLQEGWLFTPQPDLHDLSPAETIQSERQRIPLVVPRDDLLVDDDCPLCRMMAESAGPTFWHLDGCHMDDEFAFSLCLTEEEWEEERVRSDSLLDPPVANNVEGTPLGVARGELPLMAGAETVWQRSGSFPDAFDGLPAAAVIPTMLFGLGAHLAELALDLKASSESAEYVASLNRDFANLRDVVADPESTLIGAVVERFRENLASAASVRPDLVEKCADLENRLLKLSEQLGQ
ncbi:MAG: hypothetical protein ACC628_24380 [Pirellulaceae bacterium]